MSLPEERYRALLQAEKLLLRLIDDQPKSRRWIIQSATAALRHYPTESELSMLARKAPTLLRRPE